MIDRNVKAFLQENARMIIAFMVASVGVYCAATVLLLTAHVSNRFQELEATIDYQQTIIKQVATALAGSIADLKRESNGPDHHKGHQERDGSVLQHPGVGP
ncbi:MAG: hypothetical protein ACR2RE_05265 [Geminicoccaceae bacterium]